MRVFINLLITSLIYAFAITQSSLGEASFTSTARIMIRDESALQSNNITLIMNSYTRMLKSNPILYQVAEDLNLRERWGENHSGKRQPISKRLAREVLDHSTVIIQVEGTLLFDISVTRPDPNEAARIANQIAKVFGEQQRQFQVRHSQYANEFMHKALAEQQHRLDRARADLEKLHSGSTVPGKKGVESHPVYEKTRGNVDYEEMILKEMKKKIRLDLDLIYREPNLKIQLIDAAEPTILE